MKSLYSTTKKVPYWEIVTAIYISFMLSVFMAMIGPEGYYDLTAYRFRLFRGATLVYAFACLVIYGGVMLDKRLYNRRYGKTEHMQKLDITELILLCYVFWSFISAAFSPYGFKTCWQDTRNEGLWTTLLYATVFILISFWGEWQNGHIVLLSVSASIIGWIGIQQVNGSTMLYPDDYNYANSAFLSTLGQFDFMSGYFSIIFVFLLCALLFTKSKWKYITLPAMYYLFVEQKMTDVDSGKVALLAALAIMVPFIVPKAVCMAKPKINYKKVQKIAIILLVLAIIFVLIKIYKYDGDKKIIKEASGILHGKLEDSFGTGRGYIWNNSIKLVKEHKLIGSGPATYHIRTNENKISFGKTRIDAPHNDYLQILIERGVIGLLLYLSFIVSLFIRALKAYSNQGLDSIIPIMLCACVAYLTHIFFSITLAIYTPAFYILAGMLNYQIRHMGG